MTSSVLMQTIIATTLPIIINDLGHQELYGWTFSSYMIASIVTIPLFSALSDMYGRKPFYLSGMVLFLIGSLLSGFSQSMIQLIIFRVIQGIGAGAIAPAAIAMISELFEPRKRVKMLGILAAIQVFASVLGPLLGGMITDLYSWRWTFFINVPIGLIAIWLLYRNYFDITKKVPKSHQQVDYIGSITLGLFLILTIFFFQVQENSFFNLKQILLLILAGIVFIVFLIQEKKHVNPILSIALIRKKNVTNSFLSMFLLGTISYGMITILPLYGHKILGTDALSGGKLLVIFSLGIGIGGLLSGRLSKHLNFSKLIPISWFITFLGLILLNMTTVSHISFYLHIFFILLIGIGLGINLPIFIVASQNSIEEQQRAVIGGLIQISRNIGGAVSIPIFTTLIISQENTTLYLDKFELLFFIMAFLAVIGLLIGFRFKENNL